MREIVAISAMAAEMATDMLNNPLPPTNWGAGYEPEVSTTFEEYAQSYLMNAVHRAHTKNIDCEPAVKAEIAAMTDTELVNCLQLMYAHMLLAKKEVYGTPLTEYAKWVAEKTSLPIQHVEKHPAFWSDATFQVFFAEKIIGPKSMTGLINSLTAASSQARNMQPDSQPAPDMQPDSQPDAESDSDDNDMPTMN